MSSTSSTRSRPVVSATPQIDGKFGLVATEDLELMDHRPLIAHPKRNLPTWDESSGKRYRVVGQDRRDVIGDRSPGENYWATDMVQLRVVRSALSKCSTPRLAPSRLDGSRVG